MDPENVNRVKSQGGIVAVRMLTPCKAAKRTAALLIPSFSTICAIEESGTLTKTRKNVDLCMATLCPGDMLLYCENVSRVWSEEGIAPS
jgi:hypothetical protein